MIAALEVPSAEIACDGKPNGGILEERKEWAGAGIVDAAAVDPTENFKADIDLETRALLENCCPKTPEKKTQMQDCDGTTKAADIGAIGLGTTASTGVVTVQRTGSRIVEEVKQAGC